VAICHGKTASLSNARYLFSRAETLPANYAKLYLLLVLPILLALNVIFPAFHAPDDYDHVKRASTLISGEWRPVTLPGRSSGGMIDSGLISYIDAQRPVIAIRNRPLSSEQQAGYRSDDRIYWSGHLQYSEAPGAMSYMPALYVPQALALKLARAVGASVATSVFFARLANGLVGAMLVAIGLRLLPLGHSLVLATMLLPKSLLLFASNSADPILFGATITLVALAIRNWKAPSLQTRTAIWAAILCFIAGAVRPPLIMLSVPFLLKALRTRSWLSLGLIIVSILAVMSWFAMTLPFVVDLRCGALGSSAAKAVNFALNGPILIWRSIAERYVYYFASFIGELGWGNGPASYLDKPLPLWTYTAAVTMIGLAGLHDRTGSRGLSTGLRSMLFIVAIAMTIMVFFAMYAGCTGALQATIGGVQGRYFIPSVVAIAPAIARMPVDRPGSWTSLFFPGALALWCIANFATLCIEGHELYGRLLAG
jgi:hypothetical protein